MNRPSNFVRDLGSPKNGYWHYDNSGNPANGQPDTYKGTNWLTTNSLNDWGGVKAIAVFQITFFPVIRRWQLH